MGETFHDSNKLTCYDINTGQIGVQWQPSDNKDIWIFAINNQQDLAATSMYGDSTITVVDLKAAKSIASIKQDKCTPQQFVDSTTISSLHDRKNQKKQCYLILENYHARHHNTTQHLLLLTRHSIMPQQKSPPLASTMNFR